VHRRLPAGQLDRPNRPLGHRPCRGLARAQWHSVRRLLTSLPKRARILPTHGFGSFCSATPTHGALNGVQTIAQELEQNPAALLDEDDFVARLHDDLCRSFVLPLHGSLEPQGPGRALFRARRRS